MDPGEAPVPNAAHHVPRHHAPRRSAQVASDLVRLAAGQILIDTGADRARPVAAKDPAAKDAEVGREGRSTPLSPGSVKTVGSPTPGLGRSGRLHVRHMAAAGIGTRPMAASDGATAGAPGPSDVGDGHVGRENHDADDQQAFTPGW